MKRMIEKALMLGSCGLLSLVAYADTFTGLGGGDSPFENTQPTLGLNQLIQPVGFFPSRDEGVAGVPVMGMMRTFAWSLNVQSRQPGRCCPSTRTRPCFPFWVPTPSHLCRLETERSGSFTSFGQ